MNLNRIQDMDVTGKKVFLRLDLNVPVKDGKIQDDTRIREALPTIRHLLTQTNHIVIASHLGRPKGAPSSKYSLEPVGEALAGHLDREVVLMHDFSEASISRMLDRLTANQILLLENLRFNPGEEANTDEFSEQLSEGMDYYVDDAFGCVHRAHASVVGCADRFPVERRAAGLLIQKEVAALSELMRKPEHPFCVVMGGAKVSDKISVIFSLLNHCNDLIIGGAMAYTFLKFRGVDVGASRIEADKLDLVASVVRTAEARRVAIHLPTDHVVAAAFDASSPAVTVDSEVVPSGMMGLDIGPKTRKRFAQVIVGAKTTFWNGPMGVFEWPAFAGGTMSIAAAMSETSGKTVVGGGDSVAAINQSGFASRMTHISTGGGASLEFLDGQTLPGLKVLLKR